MIKLVVDCTSEIGVEEAKELGIISMPMRVTLDGEEYLAGVNLDNKTFYEKMAKSKTLPTTSQLNQSDFIEVIKPLLDSGDDVFVMSLSSELSGTFNSLRMASEELNSNKLEIFDTETITFSYQALVLEAVKLIQGGCTLKQLKTKLNHLKTKVKLLAIVDNVKNLVKGGRLSVAAGLIVGAFKIKPIVSIVEKKVKMVAKAIGYNNAKNVLCKLIKNVDEKLPVYIGHSNAPEKLEDFRRTLVERFDFNFAKTCPLGPVIGTHSGAGCVGIVYFEN